jgi:hypothetical protein
LDISSPWRRRLQPWTRGAKAQRIHQSRLLRVDADADQSLEAVTRDIALDAAA